MARSLQPGLQKDLERHIEGEVRFDDASRALYATDSSNYRQTPVGVIVPRTKLDIIAAVTACRRFGVPVLSRGGGTSLAGQCCNDAVVLDMSKYYNRLLELDVATKTARVQPGLVLDELRNEAEKHHLTFGPDPATHSRCTLGGMMGNNSCGVHALMAGKTVDNVLELEVLTYDGLVLTVGPTSEHELARLRAQTGRVGEIYRGLERLRDQYATLVRERYPRIPRRVSGYNLDELLPENGFNVARALIGTESTCVTILEAKLRLVDSPRARALVVLGFDDIYKAAEAVPAVLKQKPIGLEAIDDVLFDNIKIKHLHPERLELLPPGRSWLLVELGSDDAATTARLVREARHAYEHIAQKPSVRAFENKSEQDTVWQVREAGLGATAYVPGEKDTWEGWEDSAVPPDQVAPYLRKLHALYQKYGYKGALYGHFGQGCIHTRINFDLKSDAGRWTFRSFLAEAADLVVSFGGSLSGEHGDGQSKAEFLPRMFGPELIKAFEEFKALWDPEWKMNPGKIVKPFRADQNLRLATTTPKKVATTFRFLQDGGSFAHATLRCVGVGECRRHEHGVMCPSYRVTREEKHSTRGRAHLLYEMLTGDVLKRGWREKGVKEALDLCLACKGCKTECPTNVDMATYKAEFLSHYYRKRLRPITAYTMGLIPYWVRIASPLAGLVNALARAPLIGLLLKILAGIAPERELPRFARVTFRSWFAKRRGPSERPATVVLWTDTFNDHFHPEVAQAATEALEAIGFEVAIPKAKLCCGRPFYDYGMLRLARAHLERILDALTVELEAGLPIVVLEPSCLAVFRDELVGLFPDRPAARKLSKQAVLLSEFLEQNASQADLGRVTARALVQMHCHHRAMAETGSQESVLRRLDVEYKMLDSGCCGMAGAFGYERDHYDVSMKCAEHSLLPAVRAADKDTLILADGFSCRQQIEQGSGRKAVHLAELLRQARREN